MDILPGMGSRGSAGRGPGGFPVVAVVIHPGGAPEPVLSECLRRVRASRRVRLRVVGEPAAPQAAAPAPPAAGPPSGGCRLELPGYAGLGRRSVARLCDHARTHPAGPLHVLLPGATGGAEVVRLWCGGTDPAGAPRWQAASEFGIVDLRQPAAPLPRVERVGRWARGWLPAPAYGWLASGVKQLRRRVRQRLFLD